VFFGKDDERNISAPLPGIKQSSPRAELFAALKALETIHFNSKSSGQGTQEVYIMTDSKYVLDGLTKWCLAWEKNGWTTLEGNPVCSEDLFKRARGMMRNLGDSRIKVNIKYVPGHRGIQGNEEADKLAKWGVMMSQHSKENFDCEGLDEVIAAIEWV
jgi:ribonuclease HI